ncbi:MAG TPA: PadR family transcriptional regulator [Actinophytocola sp.]|nr:PadR family transcriptional regulator [Actinophytocola sp.]
MTKRRIANPLALAVLALLSERPMHPYEMSTTLRERAKEESIKLNYGSLYSVVESLRRHDLIDVQETIREGKRPERTVYAITDLGRDELVDWMSELLAVPVKEFTRFEAALSLMPVIAPDDVLRLVETRLVRLDAEIAAMGGVMAEMARQGMPYLWSIEADYARALRRAERDFVRNLAEKLRDGTLEGIDIWRRAHEGGDLPSEDDWARAVGRPLRSIK